jgi:hypothetical protein
MTGESTVIVETNDFFLWWRDFFWFCPNIHDSANTISPDELTTKNQQTLEISENFITEEQEAEVARKPAQQKRLEEKRCYERDY